MAAAARAISPQTAHRQAFRLEWKCQGRHGRTLMIDETHDHASCVESANGHKGFPIQNLPQSAFSSKEE